MRLLNKTQMNFAYGMGAAVVIIGARMKITHFQAGFLTGNLMLTIGLVTEAIIFALSAFDPPGEDYAWEEVYPELAGGKSGSGGDKKTPKALMSEKIDDMIKKAQLDKLLLITPDVVFLTILNGFFLLYALIESKFEKSITT